MKTKVGRGWQWDGKYSSYATCVKRKGVSMFLAVTPGLTWCVQSLGGPVSRVDEQEFRYGANYGSLPSCSSGRPWPGTTRTSSITVYPHHQPSSPPLNLPGLGAQWALSSHPHGFPVLYHYHPDPSPTWVQQSSCTRPWRRLPENTSPLRRPQLSAQLGVAAHGHRGDSERARLDRGPTRDGPYCAISVPVRCGECGLAWRQGFVVVGQASSHPTRLR